MFVMLLFPFLILATVGSSILHAYCTGPDCNLYASLYVLGVFVVFLCIGGCCAPFHDRPWWRRRHSMDAERAPVLCVAETDDAEAAPRDRDMVYADAVYSPAAAPGKGTDL
ncbi:hypothetical protein JKP88DRAFT_244159 [Tribonema minus]|uniref:Uncharacterized protein n=1 Tax=Tribonema minus TaxID=303371 RepID=A0A836CHT7_9STRA|nr:hypothetical protein JKP88DRAFT_244159 [Tribonema minus]